VSVGRVSELGPDPVVPASDLDFDSAGRLGSDCWPSFHLHIGEFANVFRRAALAVSKDRKFQETIRQHSSLDFQPRA
jgi:hypothetical protein